MSQSSRLLPTCQSARTTCQARLACSSLALFAFLLSSALLVIDLHPARADAGYPTPTFPPPPPPPTFAPPPPLPTPFPPAQVQPSSIPVNENPGGSQPLQSPNPLSNRPTLICLPLACIFSLGALVIAFIVAARQARFFTRE
jgi:hypothetical protein